jgi:hypothetical protein
MEESNSNQILDFIPTFNWSNCRKPRTAYVKTASFRAEIRTRNLSIMKHE